MGGELGIGPPLVNPMAGVVRDGWTFWRKSNFKLHEGVLVYDVPPGTSFADVSDEVRAAVKAVYRPGVIRGFGFGTLLRFNVAPADVLAVSDAIDTRNTLRGVWQWAVLTFEEDRSAVGVHTWLAGYLRPVFDSVLANLSAAGYETIQTDVSMDALTANLRAFALKANSLSRVGGLLD